MTFQFTNPVLPGFFPDPSCIFVDGIFYVVNSTFSFFPCISLHISKDLVNWQPIQSAINRPGLIDLHDAVVNGANSDGIFAPTIRYHNGTFYIVCTNCSRSGKAENFIVTSTDPINGEWSDPIPVAFHGIDPSLLFDDDGKVFFQGTMFPKIPSQGMVPAIVQMEIDISTGKSLSGPPKKLWGGFTGEWSEGPHLYKKDDWYYLLLAEGGTELGHCVTMARSKSPWGPFESHPQNPVLTARGTNQYIQAVGHADLTQDDNGNWWAMALGVRKNGDHFPLGRESFLCAITWPKNEWPCFNGGKPIEQSMTLPQPLPGSTLTQLSQVNPRKSLCLKPTTPEFLYLRNPDFSSYEWLPADRLSLTGQSANLNDPKGTSTLIGFRQTRLSSQATVTLDFAPGKTSEEAGLALYVDTYRHFEISVVPGASGQGLREVLFRTTSLKAESSVQSRISVPGNEPLRLRIESSEEAYKFSFSASHGSEVGEWVEVGEASSSLISEWGFTGPLIALFATSNGGGSASPALFSDLEYVLGDL